MDLAPLGFDDWFDAHASKVLQPGQSMARVMTVDRGAFVVRDQHGETSAELSGKFRFDAESSPDLPCVGDWVCVERKSEALAIIQAVLPRRTILQRKTPGKSVDFQLIAANVEVAFVVQSCHYDFNVPRLDRYLVVVNEGNIEPVVILSKVDLVTPADLDDMIDQIRQIGISAAILPVSSTEGTGLDDFRSMLAPGNTYCLLGSSGVGKTTLINRLMGDDALDTKAVSASGEGVHTTARRQLLLLDNGAMLVDTPGMRELGILGADDGLDDNFADITDLAPSCRFSDCGHSGEPGCAVRAAIDAGDIGEERYESYLKLRKESEYNQMSYVDKRKKDRAFGRFIKSAKKHSKR